jgi:hypothetical protein
MEDRRFCDECSERATQRVAKHRYKLTVVEDDDD